MPGKIISFAHQKGGVGKTSLTMLFANWLFTSTTVKFLVVDCDPQHTLMDYRELDLSAGLKEEDLYPLAGISINDFTKVVEELKEEYELILVDLPGTIHQKGVFSSYALIDYLFIPTSTSDAEMPKSIEFYNLYEENILKIRKDNKLDTHVYGILNKQTPNLTGYAEFKNLKSMSDGEYPLPFRFLNHEIMYHPAVFQQKSNTHKKYTNGKGESIFDPLCEELLSIISGNEEIGSFLKKSTLVNE